MEPSFRPWFRVVALGVAILFLLPWIFDLVYFFGGPAFLAWIAAGGLFLAGLFVVLKSDGRAGIG